MTKEVLSVLPVGRLTQLPFKSYALLLGYCQVHPIDIIRLAMEWWEEVGEEGCCVPENRQAAMERYYNIAYQTWCRPQPPTHGEIVYLAHLIDETTTMLVFDIAKTVTVTQSVMRMRKVSSIKPVRLLSKDQMLVAMQGDESADQVA